MTVLTQIFPCHLKLQPSNAHSCSGGMQKNQQIQKAGRAEEEEGGTKEKKEKERTTCKTNNKETTEVFNFHFK